MVDGKVKMTDFIRSNDFLRILSKLKRAFYLTDHRYMFSCD